MTLDTEIAAAKELAFLVSRAALKRAHRRSGFGWSFIDSNDLAKMQRAFSALDELERRRKP